MKGTRKHSIWLALARGQKNMPENSENITVRNLSNINRNQTNTRKNHKILFCYLEVQIYHTDVTGYVAGSKILYIGVVTQQGP